MSDKKELLSTWCKHKKAENMSKKKRVEVEKEIEVLYGNFEGKSKTFNEGDLGFKVNIKKEDSVKFDQEKYKEMRSSIPEELRPEKIKFELDSKGMEWLEKNNKEIYTLVSSCIEIRPKKASIKVEKI